MPRQARVVRVFGLLRGFCENEEVTETLEAFQEEYLKIHQQVHDNKKEGNHRLPSGTVGDEIRKRLSTSTVGDEVIRHFALDALDGAMSIISQENIALQVVPEKENAVLQIVPEKKENVIVRAEQVLVLEAIALGYSDR